MVTKAVDHTMRRLRLKVELRPKEPVFLQAMFGEGFRFGPCQRPRRQCPLGREAWVASARQHLEPHAVILLEPPGVGKNTLASGFFVVDLHRVEGRSAVAVSVANALELPSPAAGSCVTDVLRDVSNRHP